MDKINACRGIYSFTGNFFIFPFITVFQFIRNEIMIKYTYKDLSPEVLINQEERKTKMNYQIAICDDEPIICNLLKELVKKWAKKNNIKVKIQTFSSAESFLFTYEEDKGFDILLLDIEMSGMNGVDLAQIIREQNKSIQIVFITGYMDYISQGYDVEALNYLLKPVNEEKLFEVLDKAIERISVSEKVIYIESNGEMIQLPLHSILYAEVDRNYITIHTLEGKYTRKQTLTDLEDELDEGFFRVGRSFLINLMYIKRTSKTEVELKNGDIVPLARGRYEAINQAIINYF